MSSSGGQKAPSSGPVVPDIPDSLPAAGAHRLTVWLLHLQLPLCVWGSEASSGGGGAAWPRWLPEWVKGSPAQRRPSRCPPALHHSCGPTWQLRGGGWLLQQLSGPRHDHSGGKIYPVGYFTKEGPIKGSPGVPSFAAGPPSLRASTSLATPSSPAAALLAPISTSLELPHCGVPASGLCGVQPLCDGSLGSKGPCSLSSSGVSSSSSISSSSGSSFHPCGFRALLPTRHWLPSAAALAPYLVAKSSFSVLWQQVRRLWSPLHLCLLLDIEWRSRRFPT